jgi:PAS domain S-box-containing protein
MKESGVVKVLLVEDDEDDFIITRDLLSEIPGQRFTLDWLKTFDAGLAAMCQNLHDVVLVDYRLGAHDGIELLRAALERGCQAPAILLTGAGERQVDLEAMRAGAADYLVKGHLRAGSLERSIRYAVQRKRAAALAAFEQVRLAAFGADIGLALTRRDSLERTLEHCAQAMARYLNAKVAQISTFDPGKGVFEPRATAGESPEPGHPLPGVPEVKLDLSSLAQGKPVLINQLLGDKRIPDETLVKAGGLTSYAACPLVLEDKLVGLMAIFTQHPLADQVAQEMGSVANGLASCIERKRSEQALDASEVRYRSVVENIKEVIFQLDEFGNWTFLNPAWTTVTGFEVNPTVGTFFLDYIHQQDRGQNRHIFLELLKRALDHCRYETRFLTRDGKTRWVEVYVQLTHNGDPASVGVSGSLTDITDRKLAETAIQKLAAFPRVNPNPVLEFAADGTLTYANDAAKAMAKALDKDDLLSILPPNPAATVRDCLATGQKKLREEVCLGGRTITWSFFPVVASQVVHCYGADITDRLNLEAQFRHVQKLESVGQLAAGVAHDFNNILTVIQGYADCLLARDHQDSTTAKALKQISDAARRAAALTRQLLLFSRKQVIQPKVLDLNAVLQNLANMLSRLLGEDIALQFNCAPDLPAIEADTGMLEQVVMNLAVNARDAMPKGGQLCITTSRAQIEDDYVRQHPEARPGTFVCLRVSDTGCGMDRRTLDRIFEPFFSTKEIGKGTGLGLATVYGILKQHQGWIEVSSQLGSGTTFELYFPATARKPQAADTSSAPPSIRGGRETILLVEDEPNLRQFVREVLRQYEYRVIEAASGVEALKAWDEHDGQIHLLLTDMVMPEGMTGKEVAAQLRKRKPELKVVFTSGYTPEVIDTDFSRNNIAFLSKPYLPAQLAQIVRQSLDNAPSPPQASLPLALQFRS